MGGLVGLLFAGVGVFIALETAVPTFQSWRTMQSWQAHRATLIDVKGRNNNTEARYRYTWNGQNYENDRVYVAEFKDNIGSYHKNLYKQLRSQHKHRQPVTIYVDPNNPQQSVIDRDMRWGLFVLMTVFCSGFVGVGLLVVSASVNPAKEKTFKPPSTAELKREYEAKKQSGNLKESFLEYRSYRLHELKQEAKQEKTVLKSAHAWRERKGWEQNGIRSEARSGTQFMWGFAVLWNAISSPILFFLDDELKKGNYPALIGLLFPIIGIYLLYKAIKMTLEYRRFGIIKLMMDPYPGSIGGHVGGSLVVKQPYQLKTNYKIELECVYSYVSGSGEDSSRSERIRWAEEGIAKVESAIEGVKLSFRFNIPDNLPEADSEQNGDYYFWRLRLRADMPGIDLDREYNIPVLATGEQSKWISHDLSAQASERREIEASISKSAIERGDFSDTALGKSMRIYDRPNELKLYHPMFRNKFLTFFAAIFAGAFGGACWAVFSNFAGTGIIGIFAIVFMIPFALIGLIATICTLYLLFNNLTVRIRDKQVHVIRRLFIFPIINKHFKEKEITRLSTEKLGSSGQGNKKIEHYKILAHYNTGKTTTIAEGIEGEELANNFKDYLAKRI